LLFLYVEKLDQYKYKNNDKGNRNRLLISIEKWQ